MKRIAFFIATILCFTACNNDADIEKAPEAAPQITLTMPDAEKVSVYSTASESECMIDNIWVLVFNSSTKALKAAELINGNKIVKNGQATQLMPQLTIDVELGDSVVCIANADPNPDTTKLNLKLNTINSCFKLSQNRYYIGGEYLPMYGAMEWRSDNYTCEMTRAVAKIQVQMGTSVSDVTGTFSPETVTYMTTSLPMSGNVKPQTNTVAGAFSTANYSNLLQANGATDQTTTVYIYDYPNSIYSPASYPSLMDDSKFNPARTFILLRHRPNVSETYYYRLDFYDPSTKKFLDINRNHHYTFTINKVRSAGYTTVLAATNNPSSNIEYTVRIEDDAKAVTSNGQYAVVTSVDTAFISGSSAQSNLTIANVRIQLPAEMTGIIFSSESISVTSGTGLTIQSPTNFTSMTPNQNYPVVINTTSAFSSGSIGVITFKLGNITHRLVVKAT